jgi:hypothetical protein
VESIHITDSSEGRSNFGASPHHVAAQNRRGVDFMKNNVLSAPSFSPYRATVNGQR